MGLRTGVAQAVAAGYPENHPTVQARWRLQFEHSFPHRKPSVTQFAHHVLSRAMHVHRRGAEPFRHPRSRRFTSRHKHQREVVKLQLNVHDAPSKAASYSPILILPCPVERMADIVEPKSNA